MAAVKIRISRARTGIVRLHQARVVEVLDEEDLGSGSAACALLRGKQLLIPLRHVLACWGEPPASFPLIPVSPLSSLRLAAAFFNLRLLLQRSSPDR